MKMLSKSGTFLKANDINHVCPLMIGWKSIMRRITFCFFAGFLLLRLCPAAAQPVASISTASTLNEEREIFLQHFKSLSNDSAIVYPLSRYFKREINNIHDTLAADATMPETEREKAVRCLVYFMKELDKNLEQQRFDMYDIPGALRSYKSLLTAILYHKPFDQILTPLGPRRSQLLATAFSQYTEHVLLDDIAVYKRMSASPEFIVQFLESHPGFRFADSLLLRAAAHDPAKLVAYLNTGNRGIQDKIRNSKDIYLQQIVLLAGDKNAAEFLPFVVQMAKKRITPEYILEQRMDAAKYFQLLINTLREARSSEDSSCIFLEPLRAGIRQKSLDFYVNQINEQHSAADVVRFASVKELRPEDIYYIITSCGEELYTSSYLGLYKRLMAFFGDESADSLFGIVQYDQYRTFMRVAANYNVLSDFLHRMSPERMAELVKKFITGIEYNSESGLEQAMDIADFFAGLDSANDIIYLIQNELQTNLTRCRVNQQYLGMRLYNILLQVFELVKPGGAQNKVWAKLGNYEVLKREALENQRGEIVEVLLFYGDDDGVTSFNNFLKPYADKKKWGVEKNENWVSIHALSDPGLTIYANRPLDGKEEMDLKAQDSLFDFLQQQSLEPGILIHRGHSYHLDKTLKRLSPSVKLAILGSCGGYNKAISIAGINPDVQVIGSRKTGSKSVNDPIIDVINETLVNQKDLLWPEIWKKLATRFTKNEIALNIFTEYFPPNNNLSLFVLKLFVFYN